MIHSQKPCEGPREAYIEIQRDLTLREVTAVIVIDIIGIWVTHEGSIESVWIGQPAVERIPSEGGRHIGARRPPVMWPQWWVVTKATHVAPSPFTKDVTDLRHRPELVGTVLQKNQSRQRRSCASACKA